MFRILLVGAPIMILCLVLQSVFLVISLRQHDRFRIPPRYKPSPMRNIAILAAVMMIMTVGSLFQVAIWGGLFMLLGEFDQPEAALYYSAVNFSTLGYGDIVMSDRWRLLGPLESFNGILMFGVTTALMTAALNGMVRQHIVWRNKPDHTPD